MEINYTGEESSVLERKPISELRQALLHLLKELRDFFAWTFAQIPRLDLQLVMCKLKIKKGTGPIKQVSRNFRPEVEVHIKQEI